MTQAIATETKHEQDDYQGDARLFKVNPPIGYERYEEGKDGHHHNVKHKTGYVLVSAAIVAMSGPETYIFPSDSEGNVTSWLELRGSFRGDLDHARALEGAGYAVIALIEGES